MVGPIKNEYELKYIKVLLRGCPEDAEVKANWIMQEGHLFQDIFYDGKRVVKHDYVYCHCERENHIKDCVEQRTK